MVKDIYHTALRLIEPIYHSEFMKFTQTGKASEDFLEYVDRSELAQSALDMIMEHQAESIRDLFENWIED